MGNRKAFFGIAISLAFLSMETALGQTIPDSSALIQDRNAGLSDTRARGEAIAAQFLVLGRHAGNSYAERLSRFAPSFGRGPVEC
jgi:hypothetical protein